MRGGFQVSELIEGLAVAMVVFVVFVDVVVVVVRNRLGGFGLGSNKRDTNGDGG